jgi:hypothetical protein
MAAVYSVQLARVALVYPSAVVYTVPAGIVAIARDMDGYLGSASAGALLVVKHLPSCVDLIIFVATGAAIQPVQWQGRQVLSAGDQLELVLSASFSGTLNIAGYQLTAP